MSQSDTAAVREVSSQDQFLTMFWKCKVLAQRYVFMTSVVSLSESEGEILQTAN